MWAWGRCRSTYSGCGGRAYEIEKREPFFFKSWKAKGLLLRPGENQRQRDHRLWQAGRATVAAPTYFEPTRVESREPSHVSALVDGGVFANNPAMCAYASARRLYPKAERWLIVSLGTGQLERPIPYEEAKDWGLIAWARPILSLIFDGVSDAVDYQLADMPEIKYLRFQVSLRADPYDPDGANDDMDDASPDNLARLEGKAKRLLEAEGARLSELVNELKRPLAPQAALVNA